MNHLLLLKFEVGGSDVVAWLPRGRRTTVARPSHDRRTTAGRRVAADINIQYIETSFTNIKKFVSTLYKNHSDPYNI